MGLTAVCRGGRSAETRVLCAQVGERLGRYEVEKRCAVEKEDYDLAKHKKRQMEQYRAQVYAQLDLHSLVDMELVGARGACVPSAQPALGPVPPCGSRLAGPGRPQGSREGGTCSQYPSW